MSDKEKIEYESVTVKVPKRIMRFLKAFYGDPEEWLEYRIVEVINSRIDAIDKDHVIDCFNLGPVFENILER